MLCKCGGVGWGISFPIGSQQDNGVKKNRCFLFFHLETSIASKRGKEKGMSIPTPLLSPGPLLNLSLAILHFSQQLQPSLVEEGRSSLSLI